MVEFFIKQHKAVNLIFVIIIAIGANYFINGQKESFPNIGLDIISITTVYPGASANEIDTLITRKVEDAIDGVEGAKKYTSSSSEGVSVIIFEVDPDANIPVDKVTEDIEKEIDLIKNDLPDEVDDPIVNEISFGSSQPVIEVVFSGADDLELLKRVVRDFEDDVKKVDGVGKTSRQDYQKTQVQINVNGEKLKANNLEFQEIVSAVSSGNINLPAGNVDIDNEEFLIRTLGSYSDVDAVKERILRSNDSGRVIKVKNVADVAIGYEELDSYSRINGSNGLRVLVYQKETGDIIRISQGTKALIEKFKKDYPEINIFYTNDVSFYVERRLRILGQNASIGLVLVFFCLILFFDFKVTFWTTLGIPFSFCLAVIISYSLGITLNLMSMFGFIIVIGMIVDDAIIVSENIYRRRELGEDIMTASIKGTKEMLIPVLAVTLTTVAAFLPLSTLPDVFGKVLGILPKVVIITMIASFVECLLVLPGHISNTGNVNSKKKNKTTADKAKGGSRHWFVGVRQGYTKVITFLIYNPKKSLAFFVLFSFTTVFFAIQKVPFVFFPGAAEVINVSIETKISNGLDRTEKILDKVESEARANFPDDFREYVSLVGSIRGDAGPSRVRSYIGVVTLTINPDSPKTEKELVAQLKEKLSGIEGVEKMEISVRRGGPPQGNPVQVNIFGKDLNEIKTAADELLVTVGQIPNTTSVQTTYETGKEEIGLNIDEEKAAILGVNPSSLAGVVRTAFEGNTATTLNTFDDYDEEVEVLVQYDQERNVRMTDIQNLRVKNAFGERVPIANFTDIDLVVSPGKIDKENGEKYLSVTGQLEDAQNGEFNSRTINLKLKNEILPELEEKYPRLEFVIGGEEEETNKLLNGAIVALLLALFGVFFILTSIFKSYIQPFVIMTIIPFAFFGVVYGLFINNTPIGLMPMIGMVALIGVVVNGSLVMVDFINRLRTGGMEKKRAIIEGASSRLRPIIMTSITTVVGLIPLAYGIAGSEPFLAPMALAFLWGLIFSSFILVFILPVVYYLVDNMVEFFYTKILKKEYRLQARDPIKLNHRGEVDISL